MFTKQEIILDDRLILKEKNSPDSEKKTENTCLSPNSSQLEKKEIVSAVVNVSAKKQRCAFENCNKKIAKIIGDCKYCSSKFCSQHRLPEIHLCNNMKEVKNTSKKILEDKLTNEKCVGNKIDYKI